MSFVDYVKKGWEVAKLKTETIQELAVDEKAFGPALGIVAIGGACLSIGRLWLFPGIIVFPIAYLVGTFIFIWVTHFAATAFLSGKGEFKKLFTPLACASLLTWAGIIPVVGPALAWLAWLWLLVVAVVAVEKLYQLDRTKAIIAVAIPVGVMIVIWGIFALIGLSFLALAMRAH